MVIYGQVSEEYPRLRSGVYMGYVVEGINEVYVGKRFH